MENEHNATDQLALVAGHVRLLADLMLAGPDLQEVDRGAFAQVLHDLAVRLERAVEALEHERESPVQNGMEAQP
jgi:hypothetical protein